MIKARPHPHASGWEHVGVNNIYFVAQLDSLVLIASSLCVLS